jgi:hypothetical protein
MGGGCFMGNFDGILNLKSLSFSVGFSTERLPNTCNSLSFLPYFTLTQQGLFWWNEGILKTTGVPPIN